MIVAYDNGAYGGDKVLMPTDDDGCARVPEQTDNRGKALLTESGTSDENAAYDTRLTCCVKRRVVSGYAIWET